MTTRRSHAPKTSLSAVLLLCWLGRDQHGVSAFFIPDSTRQRHGVPTYFTVNDIGATHRTSYTCNKNDNRRCTGTQYMAMLEQDADIQQQRDAMIANNNYLVTDSLDLSDDERPGLWETVRNPRDGLALVLTVVGLAVSACNAQGIYNAQIYQPLQMTSIGLGFLSGVATFGQVAWGYRVDVTSNRRWLANDAYVNIYAGIYAMTVSWLAWRASVFCPPALQELDSLVPWLAATAFVLSALVPAITLWNPGHIFINESTTPPLSETELVRARGLLAIGLLACVFAPDCVAFALGGQDWWGRVSEFHPSQPILESSTALFALYANEASMVSHRCGKAGVAPFRQIVPAFAVICLLLAIVPCVASLYWLGDDISFFSFYRE